MIDREREQNGADAALELLRLAGPRPEPPVAAADRVRSAVHSHWTDRTRVDRKRQWMLAAAALLVCGLTFSLWTVHQRAQGRGDLYAATVDVVRGEVVWTLDGERLALGPNAQIDFGTAIETGESSRAAVRLADGHSLRLDNSSKLSFESPNRVRLDRGAVYVDSEGAAMSEGLRVVTPFAEVREIGTQFEVRLVENEMRVRVREGLVETTRNDETYEVSAGNGLVLGREDSVERLTVLANDPGWGWVLAVAPSFVLEGSTAGELLRWVSRETGNSVRWDSPELATNAERITLHGDISDARPDQVLDLVLPTCGLSHTVENGSVVVRTVTN